MSLSTAREATSSSGSVRMFPEVYASMARRASAPAETPSRRLISRSFFTLLRGTRYCWRMRSSAFADIPESSALSSINPKATISRIIHIHNRIHIIVEVTRSSTNTFHAMFHFWCYSGPGVAGGRALAVGLKPYVLQSNGEGEIDSGHPFVHAPCSFKNQN